MTESDLAEQAVAAGLSDRTELRDIAQGWRDWSGRPDGWFAIVHGEIRCRVPVVPLSAPRDPS